MKQKKSPRSRAGQSNYGFELLETRTMLSGWTALAHTAPAGIGTMMVLPDGTVMAQHSGQSNVWYKLTPDSSGSYQNGTWTTLASMSLTRLYFASNVLPDGRVFVLGGEYSNATTTSQNWTNTGEIYNPTTNAWTTIANYPLSQYGDVPSALMSDGRVMAGGLTSAVTYLYNPTTNTWAPGATKLNGDRSDEESWVKLADNSVLSYNIFGSAQGSQRYDPASNSWINSGAVPVQLQTSGGAELGPALRLQDGRALFIGGTNHNAIYTPSTTIGGTGSWVAAPDTPNSLGANDAPGAIFPDGNVIYAAGDTSTSFSAPTVINEYNPTTNAISSISLTGGPSLSSSSAYNTRMLMLPNGQMLFTSSTNQLYVYTEDGGVSSNSLRPAISTVTSNGSGTFTVTGTQLGGINEGSSYGDDAESSSNYPLVRLTSASGVVSYARTFGWNNTGVAASAATSTNFALPSGITSGVYKMEVVGAGIASQPVLLTIFGTSTGANVLVQKDPGNSSNVLVTTSLGTNSFPLAQFVGAYVLGDANNNSITIQDDLGALPVNVAGGAGTDTLTVQSVTAAAGNWTWNASQIGDSVTGLAINYANDLEAFSLATGSGNDVININNTLSNTTLSINAGAGTDTINVNEAAGPAVQVSILPSTGGDSLSVNADNTGAAAVNLIGTQSFGAISVGASGYVGFPSAATGQVLTATSLSVGTAAQFNLEDNDMIIDYTGSSPASTIEGFIRNGRNGGGWDGGTGIISLAARNNSLHNTTLGELESTEYKSVYGTSATFDGQTIDNTAILIKYTYYGDADFNGKIDANDYGHIDSGYQNQNSAGFIPDWFNGDFNYDGKIDANDYALIDGAYQTQSGVLRSPSLPTNVRPGGKAGGSVGRLGSVN